MNKKRKLDTYSTANSLQLKKKSGTLWIDKYKPKTTSDLAVHSKKIQEVLNWIQKLPFTSDSSSILLLTGPSGCGKTATLYALPNVCIHCWNDETQTDPVEDFTDFLLKTSRYSELSDEINTNLNKKLVLVKNFPNKFYSKPDLLHQLLIRYKAIGKCPLIIIISDSQTLKYSPHCLIPKTLQEDLNIDNISFAPIAVTLMKKAISKIIRQEKLYMNEKELQTITNQIIESSNGDIRSAINNLEIFISMQEKSSVSVDMNKDNPIFIFRALGKILYCKRETNENEIAKYNEKVQKFCRFDSNKFRPQLLFNPETVFDFCGLNYSTFVNYLHENYMDFIEDIDQLSEICDDYSYSDYLFNRWLPERSDLFGQYLISTVTRSMIYHNNSRPKNTWHPLRKSCFGDIDKTILETKRGIDEVTDLSPNLIRLENILCSKSLFIETLPFIMKIAPKDCRYSGLWKNINLLKELEFTKNQSIKHEKLDDKMAVESSDYSQLSFHSKRKVTDEWTVCKNVNEDNVSIEIDD